MLGIFLAAFSYVAALTGAGFASGREVLAFFAVYSRSGAAGIIAASIIMGAFGGIVSEYAMRADIGYSELTGRLFSCRGSRLIGILSFVFSICSLAVMCACFGELAAMTGISKIIGAAALAAASAAVILSGTGAAVKINSALGALIFISAASVCLYLLGYREHQTFSGPAAVASGASYAGYNLISVGTVLASGRVFLKRRGDGLLVGLASALMLCILLLLMWAILCIYYGRTELGELPLITLAARESRALAAAYGAVIAAAVFTTAISSDMCAAEYLSPFFGKVWAVLLCAALGFLLSAAGFSVLIDTAYRYCGAAGIFAAFAVIFKAAGRMLRNDGRRF